MFEGRASVFGTVSREGRGLERELGDAGELVRDGGVERGFWGEGESVALWSLRLRMPRWKRGDMVFVVVFRGVWCRWGWEKR